MSEVKTDLSSFSNEWYQHGSMLKRVMWYLTSAVFFKSGFPISSMKPWLLRIFGAVVGNGVVVKPHVNIKYPWKLALGNHVWIGEGVWIDNLGNVSLGDHCCLSQGSFLLCGNHDYKSTTFDLIVGDIVLEDGVWVGAKAVVCPGVTCRSHAVLAVASVATSDLEAYSIYQGNPAVLVRQRDMKA